MTHDAISTGGDQGAQVLCAECLTAHRIEPPVTYEAMKALETCPSCGAPMIQVFKGGEAEIEIGGAS